MTVHKAKASLKIEAPKPPIVISMDEGVVVFMDKWRERLGLLATKKRIDQGE